MKFKIPKRKDPNSDGYVVAPSGHMTTNNILRAGELEKAVEMAAAILAKAAEKTDNAEERGEIAAWMKRVQGIYDESDRVIETGDLWRKGNIIL